MAKQIIVCLDGTNNRVKSWLLAGGGRLRKVPRDAAVHSSVQLRLKDKPAYRKRVPESVSFVDPDWLTSVRR